MGQTADSSSPPDVRTPSRRFGPRLHVGRRWARVLAGLALLVAAVAAASAALEITPAQTVTVAGQVIKVGAAPRLRLSGPGEVDLFGQGLPTAISASGRSRFCRMSTASAFSGDT